MGTVWRAADTLLRRDVAIKEVILPPGLAPSDRDSMYERTMREARAAAALQHPAVVQVYDVVHENGRPWIVMELLDARSLADMVIEDGPVAPRVVAKIGIALLGALEVAHAFGVLHRDVKPANVLICSDGRCVLTDFGVARMPTDVQLTTPGMVLGSPHFISPERAMGSDFGPPSDLFSLGVTLYTAVEGRPPFDKGDPIETMHAVVEDPPAPTQRAGSLTPVLMGLLEKDPAQRFDVPTARTMLRQQLAGPLASKSPPHMMTDPYSVVPSQRPAAAATQAIPSSPAPQPKPTGQIGGRAMLAPGESLSGHLAKIKQGDVSTGGRRRAKESDPLTDTTGGNATSVLPPTAAGSDTTSVVPPREAWNDARAAGEPFPAGAGGGRAKLASVVRSVKEGTGRGGQTVRGWPRGKRLAAGGAALAVVAVLVLAISLSGGGGDANTPARRAGADKTTPAAFETQDYRGKGVVVKVPKGWTKASAGNWVDYIDPQDSGRKVRILVEPGAAEPRRFAERIAESTLRNSRNCPKPYNRVAVTDVQVAGHAGAQLEYTCGAGDGMRHGIWQETTVGGKMYSFYLTSNESQFDASQAIFDEMTRTFALGSG
jgi:serine/threonine protein kinase